MKLNEVFTGKDKFKNIDVVTENEVSLNPHSEFALNKEVKKICADKNYIRIYVK